MTTFTTASHNFTYEERYANSQESARLLIESVKTTHTHDQLLGVVEALRNSRRALYHGDFYDDTDRTILIQWVNTVIDGLVGYARETWNCWTMNGEHTHE